MFSWWFKCLLVIAKQCFLIHFEEPLQIFDRSTESIFILCASNEMQFLPVFFFVAFYWNAFSCRSFTDQLKLCLNINWKMCTCKCLSWYKSFKSDLTILFDIFNLRPWNSEKLLCNVAFAVSCLANDFIVYIRSTHFTCIAKAS